jgi:hypothetical protein
MRSQGCQRRASVSFMAPAEAMKMPDNSTTTAYPRHAALGDRYFLKPVLFPNEDIRGADLVFTSGVTLHLRLEG